MKPSIFIDKFPTLIIAFSCKGPIPRLTHFFIRSRGICFPFRIGRIKTASFFRRFIKLNLDGIFGHFFLFREKFYLFAPRSCPKDSVLIVICRGFQLRRGPSKTESPRFFPGRIINQLNRIAKLRRKICNSKSSGI